MHLKAAAAVVEEEAGEEEVPHERGIDIGDSEF